MKIHEHLLINSVVAVGLSTMGILDQNESLAFIAANVLDLDHVSMMVEEKTWDIGKIIQLGLDRMKIAKPGFYAFHTFEAVGFMLIVSLLFGGLVRAFVLGWCLHMILDCVQYIIKHKADFRWMRYWYIFNWKMLWKERYLSK